MNRFNDIVICIGWYDVYASLDAHCSINDIDKFVLLCANVIRLDIGYLSLPYINDVKPFLILNSIDVYIYCRV